VSVTTTVVGFTKLVVTVLTFFVLVELVVVLVTVT
jgi:hypothetical protein